MLCSAMVHASCSTWTRHLWIWPTFQPLLLSPRAVDRQRRYRPISSTRSVSQAHGALVQDSTTGCIGAHRRRYRPHRLCRQQTPAVLSPPPLSQAAALLFKLLYSQDYLTTFPCASAAGDKLPLCAVL